VLGAAVVAGGGVDDDAVADGVGVLDSADEGAEELDPSEQPVTIKAMAALRQAEVRKRFGMVPASWLGK